jgi:hypothetical protein
MDDDDVRRVRRSHGFARAVLKMAMAPDAEINPDELLTAMAMVIGSIVKYHWREKDWNETVSIIVSQVDELLKDNKLNFDSEDVNPS